MSDNIPSEIQEEIIKRIHPVKHLLRFRTVSKQWKSLIDSPEFIALHHSINQTGTHHILIKYNKQKYVSVVDDDTNPQHKFYPTAPPTVNLHDLPSLRPGSYGLVCSCGYVRDRQDYMIVVWNPSIRKSFSVVMSGDRLIAFGFGVCPKTHDIKIVKVTNPSQRTTDLKAEVFALSTGVWRTISINPRLRVLSFGSLPRQVVIDGIIYWASSNFGGSIVKFDLISEEFEQVGLHCSFRRPVSPFIYKPTESLALLYNNKEVMLYDVWKMIKTGDSNSSFEKLYSFSYKSSVSYSLEGFRMNGQPIMMQYPRGTLKVYDRSSRHMNDLVIDVDAFDSDDSFGMASYTESLFLLNQPESIFQ